MAKAGNARQAPERRSRTRMRTPIEMRRCGAKCPAAGIDVLHVDAVELIDEIGDGWRAAFSFERLDLGTDTFPDDFGRRSPTQASAKIRRECD